MPKVSVLTSVYNTQPEHLRQCINSILNQTFTDFEFLILNDSPDNTSIDSIIAEFNDSRIKYYKNDKNLGISPSRNKLLDMASGEYIAVFDHDDISLPNRLAVQTEYLDTHPDIGVVGSCLQLFEQKSDIWACPELDSDIRICMTNRCCIYHTSTMIRKSVLTDNNIRYESEYTPAEDYRLWMRLMAVTRFYNFQTPLVKYRYFNTNTSATYAHTQDYIGHGIALALRNIYPAYWEEYKRTHRRVRVRLFGVITLVKQRGRWILLFDFIPVLKLK